MSHASTVRLRFAPSPTGLLHIGGLRTALYNYLFARQQGGTFILRIEDTDQSRFVAEAEPDILDSLKWAGLHFDEGPGMAGDVGPYYQSQRKDLYRRYADQLVEAGHAYLAFDTKEDIEAMRERLMQGGNPAPKYDNVTRMAMTNSLTLSAEDVNERVAKGEPYVIRLKVPMNVTVRFSDQVRGDVAIETSGIDDQVLVKSDGLPTYHLANVVDDHHMGITHVIRGEEWLPSVPKHILLYQYLGWEPPQMAHLPLILSPTGGKLSKRNADKMGIPVSVKQYREAGYEPEALINFLAFLGWNPGTEQELFSLDELVGAFSLGRVGSAGVQFSMDKLRWYNQQYLRAKTPSEVAMQATGVVEATGYNIEPSYLVNVMALVQERLTFVDDVVSDFPYLFEDPTEYDPKAVKKRWKADSSSLLAAYAKRLAALETFTHETVEQALRAVTAEAGVGLGKLMLPARLSVSGKTSGPGLYEMIVLLGQEQTVRRMHAAIERIVK